MKPNFLTRVLLLFCLPALLLAGCDKKDVSNKEPTYKTEVNVEDVTTKKDKRYLVLVNKEHPVTDAYNPATEDYVLEPLQNIEPGADKWKWAKKEMKLEGKTLRALTAMLTEMEADGVTDIFVTSAYRDFETQERLFENYYEAEKGQAASSTRAIYYLGEDYVKEHYTDRGIVVLSDEDAGKIANFYSAHPGESEHQTGLCVDFMTGTMKALDNTFAETAASAWLRANAHRFGFIMRYPQEKESVTGYCYEPWHYRFVGREAATEIFHSNVALEEYLNG